MGPKKQPKKQPTTAIERVDYAAAAKKSLPVPKLNLTPNERSTSARSTARTGRVTRPTSARSAASTATNTSRRSSRQSSSSSLPTDRSKNNNSTLSREMSDVSMLTDRSETSDNNTFYAIAFKIENINGSRTLKMLPRIPENVNSSDSIEFNANEFDKCPSEECATIVGNNSDQDDAIVFLNKFFHSNGNDFNIGVLNELGPYK